MLRYVKANGQWYDTLTELLRGNAIHEIDGHVYVLTSAGEEDKYLGELEDEKESMEDY